MLFVLEYMCTINRVFGNVLLLGRQLCPYQDKVMKWIGFCEIALLSGKLEVSKYWEGSILQCFRESMELVWCGVGQWENMCGKAGIQGFPRHTKWVVWMGFCLRRHFGIFLAPESCIEECVCTNIVPRECSSPVYVVHSLRNAFPEIEGVHVKTHFSSNSLAKHDLFAKMLSYLW